jgi:hypothetical protein
MMRDLNMVRVASRAAQIAQDANAVYWADQKSTEIHLRKTIDDMFRQLAESLGYSIEKRDPLPSISQTVGDI